jgi:serine protease Do
MPEPLNGKDLLAEEIFAINNNTAYLVYAQKTGSTSDISQGSGVAVSEDTLLTNCHVLEGQNEFYLMKQELVIDAILTFADVSSDRCMLFTPNHKLIPIKGIRPLSTLKIGEPAYTIGSPQGLENTLGQGLISGIRNEMGMSLIQTTAEISPGSSGGGLFDQKGNLIGITRFLLKESQGLNFAISAADFWN